MKFNKDKKKAQTAIAAKRIKELFKQANLTDSEVLAKKYVQLAKRISMKYKTKFTAEQKIRFCKKCQNHLKPGINSRIRVHKGKRIILCKHCKNIMRFAFK